MKKFYVTLISLFIIPTLSFAGFPDGYYSRLDGKKKDALKTAAKQCVQSHTRLDYYDLPNYWQYSDVYPETVNGLKRWWDMYSDAVYLIQKNQSGKQSFSANKMQREHAVPKSWWKKGGDVEYTPAYSDMWNLYPSDAAANQAKSNYPFGVTRTTSFDNGVTKIGAPKAGYGGGSSTVFEPADQYKGDFARAIFYMATVYDDLSWVYDYMFVSNTYPTLVPWAINMLLQWSRQDPVSQKERDRNDYVEQYQGNRNPFVDFPNLAEYIWGISTEETFFVADQENSDPTPPITGDPQVIAPVNGESLDFGQTAVGHAVNRVLQISGHNMTSPLSVRIVGTDRSYFIPEVTSIPAATMNNNGGYLLNITYLPQTIGKHEARVTLYDGGLAGSIAVTLIAEALDMPQLSALTALPASDITATGYTANWQPASGIADYYIITRVKYNNGNEEVETYETGETYYTFTDRMADVAESYSVTYSRLGIESPMSNSIYVAGSGIDSIYEYEDVPCHIYGVEGGIMVSRAPGENADFTVYDINGNLIYTAIDMPDQSIIPLQKGVYVIVSPARKPTKIIVK